MFEFIPSYAALHSILLIVITIVHVGDGNILAFVLLLASLIVDAFLNVGKFKVVDEHLGFLVHISFGVVLPSAWSALFSLPMNQLHPVFCHLFAMRGNLHS